MFRCTLAVLLILIHASIVCAQTIKLGELPNPICVDTEVQIPVSVTGTFASNNSFQVQFSKGYYGYNQNITTYPAELIDGKLRVTLKGVPYQSTVISCYLRVVSTSPVVQSDWSNDFYPRFSANVALSSSSDAINAYDPYVIQLSGNGSTPLNFTINDSLNVTVGDGYSDTIDQRLTLYPSRNGLFRLTSVQNTCGKGQGSGSAQVKINPISLRITSLSASALCVGSAFQLNYDKSGGSFSPGNQFKIRFTRVSTQKSVDVDAVEENGSLKGILPDALFNGSDYLYTIHEVRILTTQPTIVSAPAEKTIYAFPRSKASLITPGQLIDEGQAVNLVIQASGLLPYSAVFDDGSVALQTSFYENIVHTVQPTQSTSYSLVSFSSGCGQGSTDRNVVYVSVRKGITIDSLPETILCEGQQIQLRTHANETFSAGAKYTVLLVEQYNENVVAEVPATLSGNKLTIVIPTLPPNSSNNKLSYRLRVRVNDLQSVYTGPLTQLPIQMQLKPKALINPASPASVNAAGDALYISVTYTGGGPYTVTMSDGSVFHNNASGDNYYGSLILFPLQSGAYTIKEVKNQCFTGTSEGSVQVNVLDNNRAGMLLRTLRYTQMNPPYLCSQDSVPIQFSTFGKFEANNVFSIQVQKDYGTWVTVATNVKPGLSRILLNPGNFQIRIASSNPLQYSQPISAPVAQPAEASLTSNYSGATSFTPTIGEFRSFNVSVSGGIGPFRVVLSDGTTDFARIITTNTLSQQTLNEQIKINRTVTYLIKSLTDKCGVGIVQNKPITYTAKPFLMSVAAPSNYFACAGNTITLPFSILGAPSGNVTCQLQIARVSGSFTNIGEAITQSPFTGKLPTDLPAGTYQFRAVTSNPDIISNVFSIEIRTKPTAILTTSTGTNEVSADTGPVQLKLALTGGSTPESTYQVVFSDDVVRILNNSYTERDVNPNVRTVYSLKSITGSCGFGTVSGQVTVNVKPSVALQVPSFSSGGNRVCVGQPLSVSFTSRGELGAKNIVQLFLRSYTSSLKLTLDSSRSSSGKFNVVIPSTLPPGDYQLQLTASDPVLSASLDFYISAPPKLVISGNTLINAGQTAYLVITPTELITNQEDINIVLSTGQRLTRRAYSSGIDPTYAAVTPTQTTTYTITSLQNSCGLGQSSGSAVVSVNPVSSSSIAVIQIGNSPGITRFCIGDTLPLTYDVTGNLPAGSTLIAQISDSTGANFSDLPTLTGSNNVVRAIMPKSLPRGNGYRVRLRSSDPTVTGGAYAYPLSIRNRATAQFSTPSITYQSGKPARAIVLLGGDGPWSYRIATDNSSISRYVLKSPDTLILQPVSPAVFFKLSVVTNAWCGVGQLLEPTTLRVELLTAVEPFSARVIVSPNPTTGLLHVNWSKLNAEPVDIQLLSVSGTMLLFKKSHLLTETLSLVGMPTGIYFLRIQQSNQVQTFRIIKQ